MAARPLRSEHDELRREHLVNEQVARYEGLVHKTASLYAPFVQVEYEDCVSILRIKVWKALEAYDPARARQPVEKYVFMCMKNQAKDLLRRRRRYEEYIDPADHRFEADHFAISHEEMFMLVEDELPLIPSTLTEIERQLVGLLYLAFSQREAALQLGLTRGDMERAIRSIRSKMADWAPVPQPVEVAA